MELRCCRCLAAPRDRPPGDYLHCAHAPPWANEGCTNAHSAISQLARTQTSPTYVLEPFKTSVHAMHIMQATPVCVTVPARRPQRRRSDSAGSHGPVGTGLFQQTSCPQPPGSTTVFCPHSSTGTRQCIYRTHGNTRIGNTAMHAPVHALSISARVLYQQEFLPPAECMQERA